MAKNDELIFTLNTGELSDAGFTGSFNDFAKDLENAGATVSGEYDDEGNPVMSVYGVDTDTVNDLLADYGVDEPEEFTKIVDDAENFDFGDDGDDNGEPIDDDDEEIDIVDDDDFGDGMDEGCCAPKPRKKGIKESRVPKGTANLSEAVTDAILDDAIDKAMYGRIVESWDKKKAQAERVRNYRCPFPFANIQVDGKSLLEMSVSEVEEKLVETKFNYRKYYSTYKGLNESRVDDRKKFASVLRKQSRLIELLENFHKFSTGHLFEEDLLSVDKTKPSTPESEGKEQVATLTGIVFRVKSADKFIKVLTDNGIPEEALEKVNKDEAKPEETQEEAPQQPQEQQPQQPAPAAAPAPSTGNPFESLTTRLAGKLNEDDASNPFGNPDQPAEDSGVDPLNTESHDNNDEGEEVRLVDTSYAAKVQKILADVYHFPTEKFDEKIGGQLVDGESDDEQSSEDSEVEQKDDPDKTGEEESIDPADVFGDLDI